MTPEELERIDNIEKKLDELIKLHYSIHFIDKSVFKYPVVFNDNISTDNLLGIKIGKTTDKLGMFGVTPVVQQSAITAPTGAGDAGVDSPARTAINDIITKLQNLGLTL